MVAAGFPLHVILRGVDRGAVFFGADDHRYFLARLAEFAEAESAAVHAYVLMTNHLHLLTMAEMDDGVSRLMKRLAQSYVQYVNRASPFKVSLRVRY